MKPFKGEKGYSLIELMVAMAVMLIGLTASYTLFKLGYKYLNLGTNVTQAQQGARMAFETMIKELQETSANTVWVADGAISFASARDESNNFSTTAEEKPDWKKAVVYFRDAESNILYRYEEAKDDWSAKFDPSLAVGAENLKEIATSVDSMVFQLDSNLLSINITIMEDTQEGIASEELTTAIRLQN